LPFELVDQFPQTHANILVALFLYDQTTPGFLVGQALLKALQDFNVGELALGEPCLCHDTEPFPKHSKRLWAVGNDNYGLLYGRASDVCWPVDKLGGIELPCARDAEQGGRRSPIGCGLEQSEVREIFFGAESNGCEHVFGVKRGG
jgi:hypothetical protein